jgi:hypothetical protein
MPSAEAAAGIAPRSWSACTTSTTARREGSDRSEVTAALTELESRRLVERKIDPRTKVGTSLPSRPEARKY